IDYYSYGRDERTTRVVDPHAVFAHQGAWYLRGWCHLARDRRVFRVDRIVEATVLDEPVERPGAPEEGADDPFELGPDVPRVTLELDPSARWVVETYPVDAVEELGEGRLRVRLAVAATPWLERLLVRLGPAARVVAADDPALAEAGVRAARRILARYRRCPPGERAARSRRPAGPRASLHGAARDVSPLRGLPGDDRHGSPPADPAARRRTGPRHLARDRGPRRRDPDADADRTADDADGAEDDGKEPRHGPWRAVLEWVAVIGCGVLIALAAQTFLVQAFWIPSPSMAPTLEVGDRVLVNKLAYRAHEVRRGDLVVFERPPNASNGQEDEIKDLIKRVIAVEGD